MIEAAIIICLYRKAGKRMPKTKEYKMRKAVRHVAETLVRIERVLHDIGLVETARAANEVSKKLGWEAKKKLDEALLTQKSAGLTH